MKCECCGNKEATYEVMVPEFRGPGKHRCAECAETARRSYSDVVIEEKKNIGG